MSKLEVAKQKAKEKVIAKAKDLGLTEEDLKILRGE